jgi:hypothetical protein
VKPVRISAFRSSNPVRISANPAVTSSCRVVAVAVRSQLTSALLSTLICALDGFGQPAIGSNAA